MLLNDHINECHRDGVCVNDISCKQKRLFWTRLIAINRLTGLI